MKISTKLIRTSFHTLVYVTVSLLVLAALFLSVARLMLPAIEDYKPDIEQRVSELLGQQVEIATLDAAWFGLEPQLVLKGVQLLSDDRTETFGFLQQARIGLNIFGSLFEGSLKPGGLTVEGAHLVIVRQADGNISISGLERGATQKATNPNQAISDWLFNQRILDVKDSEIIWLDENQIGTEWRFSSVNLRFRNDGDHHLINGSVTLPKELGARLEVAMDARGDLLSAKGWSGSAYIEGANLNLDQWLRDQELGDVSISNGMLGLRLWSQWRKAELYSLKGEVFSNGFQISKKNAPKIQVIESLSSNLLVQKMSGTWEATFDELVISTAKKVWPQARIDMKLDEESSMLKAEISYIDVNDILPVVKLFVDEDTKTGEMLRQLKPAGVVSNIGVSVSDLNNKPKFLVGAQFSQFSSSPWKKIPGVKNLDGRFTINNKAFKLTLPTQDFRLDYAGVFDYPANLKNTTGSVFWLNDNNGFELVAKHIQAEYRGAEANGSLRFSKFTDQDPALDLAFYFKHGQVENARYYIPARIMNRKAVDWINGALVGGAVTSGGISYYGNIKKFPFYKNEGLFNLVLNVNNGTLLFAKDWPEIYNINGQFNMAANSLNFIGETANSLGSDLSSVKVNLPVFRTKDRRVIISGNVLGDSENKIRYLHESPLEDIFAKNIRPLKVQGDSKLNLSLNIPLADVKKTEAHGVVSVKNNHLTAEEWKLDIQKLTTDLRFDNKGIYTDKVVGFMDELELNGSIDTIDLDKTQRNIMITGGGKVNGEKIKTLLHQFIDKGHWGDYIAGQSQIDTELTIPILLANKEESPKINLKLNANLENIEVDLPYPLYKDISTPDTLNLSADLSGEKRFLKINTDSLNALFEIEPAGNTQQITRGGIGFKQKAELPSENGYRFLGHLDHFSWTQWEPVIFPAEGETPLLEGGGSGGSQYFNVVINRLEIFGSWFGKTSVQASSGAQLWSIHLGGDELAGEIFIPVVLSSAPLIMNMEKLHIVRGKSDVDQPDEYLDPLLMPEIKVKAKNFSYNQKHFGALNVVASKIKTGLHLDQFSMNTKDTRISATGNWNEVDKKQLSQFDIQVETSHVGRTIKSWGFADAFGSGHGKVNIRANWPGKPSDFSFDIATGNMDVSIQDASLLDFELGAAKMVGLFLPRRLLLDFRDVFNKGMYFDSIKGQYKIEDGNAFTTDFNLDGPVADIQMAGRIGLVDEDYDQLVTVNRRLVGDSISTLAALATNPIVNPLLAAQIYALKKLFEKQIDDILSVQYTIKGSWESPKITPVVKNLEERGESVDELFE